MQQLLDTHLHLIYPDKIGYGWTKGIEALANQPFEIKNYLGLTADKEVAGSLFMEAGVDDSDYQAETRFIAELAADPNQRIVGLIASCRPEQDAGFGAWLDECADMPVPGYRRILHVVDDALSQSDIFRSNVRKIGARGQTFDLCFLARQLPIATELAAACDNTQMVLNHCGVPDIAGGGLDPWRQNISSLAALPNVACKVSGLPAYCAPGTQSLETISPWLDHVLEAFGPDRLVWGSDWPVVNLGGGLPAWLEITGKYLASLSPEEAAKIASGNARRIYKLA